DLQRVRRVVWCHNLCRLHRLQVPLGSDAARERRRGDFESRDRGVAGAGGGEERHQSDRDGCEPDSRVTYGLTPLTRRFAAPSPGGRGTLGGAAVPSPHGRGWPEGPGEGRTLHDLLSALSFLSTSTRSPSPRPETT